MEHKESYNTFVFIAIENWKVLTTIDPFFPGITAILDCIMFLTLIYTEPFFPKINFARVGFQGGLF